MADQHPRQGPGLVNTPGGGAVGVRAAVGAGGDCGGGQQSVAQCVCGTVCGAICVWSSLCDAVCAWCSVCVGALCGAVCMAQCVRGGSGCMT